MCINENTKHSDAISNIVKTFNAEGYHLIFIDHQKHEKRIPDAILLKEGNIVAIEVETNPRALFRKYQRDKETAFYTEIVYVLVNKTFYDLFSQNELKTIDIIEKYVNRLKNLRKITKHLKIEHQREMRLLKRKESMKPLRRKKILYTNASVIKNVQIISTDKNVYSSRSLAAIWRLYCYLDCSAVYIQTILNSIVKQRLSYSEVKTFLIIIKAILDVCKVTKQSFNEIVDELNFDKI